MSRMSRPTRLRRLQTRIYKASANRVLSCYWTTATLGRVKCRGIVTRHKESSLNVFSRFICLCICPCLCLLIDQVMSRHHSDRQHIGSSWIFPYILLFDKLILTKLFWRQYVWYSFLSRLKTTFQRLSDKDDKQISSIILLCLYFQNILICLHFPHFLCNTAFSYIFPSTLALSLIAVTFGGTQLQKLWLI